MDFRPSRVLGQNFLTDGNILRIMLELAELSARESVLEVGPGLGVLTGPLAERVQRVVAVEKDPRLFGIARERLREFANIEWWNADILDVDLPGLLRTGIDKVVSNLPYSAGTRFLIELAGLTGAPPRLVVTVQDDVAQRLAASPGSKAYGLASVLMQARFDVAVAKRVSPRCFFPPPQVQSAIVVITLRPDRRNLPEDPVYASFKEILKTAFSHRRKQIHNLLHHQAADRVLAQLEIAPTTRPESLSPDQWWKLASELRRKSTTDNHG